MTACYAETRPATDVTATSANLRASGHTDSTPAQFYFEYATKAEQLGTLLSFTTPRRDVPAGVPGPGKPDVAFQQTVKALLPSTTYHFRICGRDGGTDGDVCGRTLSFTTAPGAREVNFTTRRFMLPVANYHGIPQADAADFNRDGKLDLALADERGISLRLGDGNGGFGSPHEVSSTNSTFAVGSDLNEDGRPDLIAGRYTPLPAAVSVRLGDGSGGFGPVVSSTSLEGGPRKPIVRDFDRDGDADLAVLRRVGAGPGPGELFALVLEGDGDGHLTRVEDPALEQFHALDLAAADVNDDGRLDLVGLPTPEAPVTVLGRGDLTFGDKLTSPGVDLVWDELVLGDYDRDGRTDAVGSGYAEGAVLRGDGEGRFGRALTFSSDGAAGRLLRGDFNRDAIPDLVAGRLTSILLGEGDGSLRTPNMFPIGLPQLVADFNRDGRQDILAVELVEPCPCTQAEVQMLINTTP